MPKLLRIVAGIVLLLGLVAMGHTWPESYSLYSSTLQESLKPAQRLAALAYLFSAIITSLLFFALAEVLGHLRALRGALAPAGAAAGKDTEGDPFGELEFGEMWDCKQCGTANSRGRVVCHQCEAERVRR